ncbi:pirin domain protein [Parvularcula bermudensis HTCC2503]|uniref:Pirin domain protein n=1 Tax=Parvularcula bermudensis (strain ATCC BAA-594 / HTCC2503 / KCTC 12087) TaxID=314260 RepID=E0TFG5_PARBH|nr:pirin family protein [Parvularcula bermudensis]ADM10089.1 pirin domain protein [Parvularcula bermudensis HTCC2503]
MSRKNDLPPKAHEPNAEIETIIVPRARDLGGFSVRRALPSSERQMVGPFIFFDQIGPAEFAPGKAVDVRPHPHIGLATATYLYEGALRHRDSLGNALDITPGAVNWMIAGKGITHSERSPEETRGQARRLSGIQTWVALPQDKEDMPPHFEHHGAASRPVLSDKGVEMRVILGRAYGEVAAATLLSDTLYVDVHLAEGASVPVPDDHEDRAIYVVDGRCRVAGQTIEAGECAVFGSINALTLKAEEGPVRLLLFGGETADGPRHIWWNFVASSMEKIEAAKADWAAARWQEGRFQLPPDDAEEFIPLPSP